MNVDGNCASWKKLFIDKPVGIFFITFAYKWLLTIYGNDTILFDLIYFTLNIIPNIWQIKYYS